MSIACGTAIAHEASWITAVTLYPGSATVERTARIAPGMTRLEISGLPANFDPQTVRVESDAGVRIGEVSTQDQSRTAASNARESAIEDRIQALKDRQAVLEVDAKSAQLAADYIARLGAPAPGTEKAAPAMNGKSVAEVIEAVRRGGSDAFGRIQRVQVQKREIDKEIRALERDLARLKSGARDVRTIAIGVSAEHPGEVRVSYQVNGAGWRPAYRAGLDSAGSKVLLERQGAISQTTGEDWTNVKLKLSTGQPRHHAQAHFRGERELRERHGQLAAVGGQAHRPGHFELGRERGLYFDRRIRFALVSHLALRRGGRNGGTIGHLGHGADVRARFEQRQLPRTRLGPLRREPRLAGGEFELDVRPVLARGLRDGALAFE